MVYSLPYRSVQHLSVSLLQGSVFSRKLFLSICSCVHMTGLSVHCLYVTQRSGGPEITDFVNKYTQISDQNRVKTHMHPVKKGL